MTTNILLLRSALLVSLGLLLLGARYIHGVRQQTRRQMDEVKRTREELQALADDITQRKQQEDVLRQTEEQLRTANEWLTEGTGLLEHQIAHINEQTAQLERQKAALEAVNARLEALATTDGLTGLKNHRAFQERLREEVERANRYNAPLSLLLLDVDKFKTYNDTYGHLAGDAILRKVAEVLQAIARNTDMVARYGGEEFAVILTEVDAENAIIAAERFRAAIEETSWTERQITASFGVATWSREMPDPAALLAAADKALYRAKERGRNCVENASQD